jgi:hypothetical protein
MVRTMSSAWDCRSCIDQFFTGVRCAKPGHNMTPEEREAQRGLSDKRVIPPTSRVGHLAADGRGATNPSAAVPAEPEFAF